MHAHVNIWHSTDAGESSSDESAKEMAAVLSQQSGFHSYTLVRSGEREFIAITLFETNAQLHAALQAAEPVVRTRVDRLTAGPPAHHQGDVLFHLDHRDPGAHGH
jgi:heme-degrading monooxygenase HmoA